MGETREAEESQRRLTDDETVEYMLRNLTVHLRSLKAERDSLRSELNDAREERDAFRAAIVRRTEAWRGLSENASLKQNPVVATMYEGCAAELEAILRGQNDGTYPRLSKVELAAMRERAAVLSNKLDEGKGTTG